MFIFYFLLFYSFLSFKCVFSPNLQHENANFSFYFYRSIFMGRVAFYNF